MGVISLKLDAHTKRTNELTEREREERETHFTVLASFQGKTRIRVTKTYLLKYIRMIFLSLATLGNLSTYVLKLRIVLGYLDVFQANLFFFIQMAIGICIMHVQQIL